MEIFENNRSTALCFNKESFASPDFSVDKFVSSCRKYVSLETMLEDLGLYNKILCASMLELINKDYADFVNLSSNLVGLDKSIKNLSSPLDQLKTEVESEESKLNLVLNDVNENFKVYSMLHTRKAQAIYFSKLVEGLKQAERFLNFSLASDKMLPSEIERIALDLNQCQFFMKKIPFDSHSTREEKIQMVLLQVNDKLKGHLEKMFLECLSEKNVFLLVQILHIYSITCSEEEAENYFRKTFVKPYMQKHITEDNILKHGLPNLYRQILDFIPNFCSTILDATEEKSSKQYLNASGYDFLVNSVFTEIVNAFELITTVQIYAPGNPELFYRNFSATVSFLDQFESYCKSQSSIEKLRSHPIYKSFLKKWNINLYFEICFQEIAGDFESCLSAETFNIRINEGNNSMSKDSENVCIFNSSKSLLQSVHRCWSENVFLYHLSSRFYQLTLQLISRFSKWLHTSLQHDSISTPLQASMVLQDVELLVSDLQTIFAHEIASKISTHLVEASFQESLMMLKAVLPIATSLLIKLLFSESCSHLKMINDIPRLYRKTNRNIPSKSSSYVASVFDKLGEFLKTTESILSSEIKTSCLKEVTEKILSESHALIEDVLTSIQKMEHSLKILKRAKDKKETGHITDDDKIRRQLALDIEAIEARIKQLGLETDNLKNFKELKLLLNLCEKKGS